MKPQSTFVVVVVASFVFSMRKKTLSFFSNCFNDWKKRLTAANVLKRLCLPTNIYLKWKYFDAHVKHSFASNDPSKQIIKSFRDVWSWTGRTSWNERMAFFLCGFTAMGRFSPPLLGSFLPFCLIAASLAALNILSG